MGSASCLAARADCRVRGLGHGSLATPERYLHLTITDLKSGKHTDVNNKGAKT